MKVRYVGPYDVLFMYEGKVWEVHPGDEMDLPFLPYPNWEAVDGEGAEDAAPRKGGRR